MSASSSPAGRKRKAPNNAPASQSHTRKRQRFQNTKDARIIQTQTADKALSNTGELNIASFVKAREYEIKKLEEGMKKARQFLSTRAFQQVPRHLRRRAASHNAKKVPRRLQRRARREMIEDNTPTVNSKSRTPSSRLRLRLETAKELKKLTQKRKTMRQKKREAKMNSTETDPSKHVEIVRKPRLRKNKLADAPLATSKFKRRQVSKTWLPTHLWHTKRAHMTCPTDPLWRMAIPMRPTEKCYRATHRASGSRGCAAWDMSYISTIGCIGTEKALEGLLKALGFHGNGWGGQKYHRWKAGSRFASGWVSKRDGLEGVGNVDVLWLASNKDQPADSAKQDEDTEMGSSEHEAKRKRTKLDKQIMIRIHPSTFHQFWLELLQVAKLQKPQVLVEDLRFEIGSIETMGPNSSEALVGALAPGEADEEVRRFWEAVMPLSTPALLPLNVAIGFNSQDPRLLPAIKSAQASLSGDGEEVLYQSIVNWPLDKNTMPSSLFSHKARFLASQLPSQWTLNRRRQKLLPGQMIPSSAKDPSIPVILLAHRSNSPAHTQAGRWTLLAPWKCIDVIWRKLLSIPLSTGRTPRFGGLREQQQISFEQHTPWYPGDFPGTEAGKAWERSQAEQRFDEWIRRPPSRRIAWDAIDLGLHRKGELGRGWSCDWEYLFNNTSETSEASKSRVTTRPTENQRTIQPTQPLLTQRQRKAAEIKAKVDENEQADKRRRNTSSPESEDDVQTKSHESIRYTQLTPLVARLLLQQTIPSSLPKDPALVAIRITFLTKGTPSSAARIYRLPKVKMNAISERIDSRANDLIPKPSLSNSTPPAAQKSPRRTSSIESKDGNGGQNIDLRYRWLSLDPGRVPRNMLSNTKKDKLNHRGLSRKAHHYEQESLRHINVLPKNPPLEIIEQYGRKPLSEEERKLNAQKALAIHMEEQQVWDKHIPCPDAEDLIGFVTSGGYNLADGWGTAIGSVWLQKVLTGWTASEGRGLTESSISTSRSPISVPTADLQMKVSPSMQRERHLCIVRNVGESVGRLAIWDVCD